MNTKLSVTGISGISATLLIPVWARAAETLRANPIIRDPYALKMKERIDFDFSKLDSMDPERKMIFQRGIAVRTKIIDNSINEFLFNNPNALIINMGCGLDSKFFRLDNGKMQWLDVDLKEVIDIKRIFFQETDRYRMLSASILDEEWIDKIPREKGQPLMIISEGTLYFFQLNEVRRLIDRLVDRFPYVEFLIEVMGSWHQGKIHPAFASLGINLKFAWGIDDYSIFEKWNAKLKLSKSMNLFDYNRDRLSKKIRLLTWLWPGLKRRLTSAIIHLICVDTKNNF
jgi:O-methyltransferase involved in polyketide biosynthesis